MVVGVGAVGAADMEESERCRGRCRRLRRPPSRGERGEPPGAEVPGASLVRSGSSSPRADRRAVAGGRARRRGRRALLSRRSWTPASGLVRHVARSARACKTRPDTPWWVDQETCHGDSAVQRLRGDEPCGGRAARGAARLRWVQGTARRGGAPQEVGGAAFERAVASSPVPVLVDFWAEWCGPCRTAAPAVAELARRNVGRLVVLRVNVDEDPAGRPVTGSRASPRSCCSRTGERSHAGQGSRRAPIWRDGSRGPRGARGRTRDRSRRCGAGRRRPGASVTPSVAPHHARELLDVRCARRARRPALGEGRLENTKAEEPARAPHHAAAA